MRNLAELLVRCRQQSPQARIGMITAPQSYAELFDRAARLAGLLRQADLRPGARIALVGGSSNEFLQAWMAMQLSGVAPALINPDYPPELLGGMLADLSPDAVMWTRPPIASTLAVNLRQIDLSELDASRASIDGQPVSLPTAPSSFDGLNADSSTTAGFMHTSGTTGAPKFCQQSQGYFLALADYVAKVMALSEADTVYCPLPLFHVNPLGYALLGSLTGGASVLFQERFSATEFWGNVHRANVTALFMHSPPIEILKRATTHQQAAGHRVRIVFFADEEFLNRFEIPTGISGYGSTEGGGLSHTWQWERGQHCDHLEGMSRYGGTARPDVEWKVVDDEIFIRARRTNVLFDGYRRGDNVADGVDSDGWYATGDVGRVDELGNLIFRERRSESIRVRGEFVPIGFVEDHLARSLGSSEIALWRRPSDLVDHELALFVADTRVTPEAIEAAARSLPRFMRPSVLIRVLDIPRDSGVGKIRRRELEGMTATEMTPLL